MHLDLLDYQDELRAAGAAHPGPWPEGVGLRGRYGDGARRRLDAVRERGLNGQALFAEYAFAQVMGWNDWPTTRSGGVVRGYRVRPTDYADGCALVRDEDPDEAILVHIFLKGLRYRCVGWIRGRDAKRQGRRRDLGNGRSVWFVSQSALHPMDTLPALDGAAQGRETP